MPNANAQALEDAIQSATNASTAKFDQALNEFKERAGRVAQDTLESLRTQAKPYISDASDHFATAERYVVERVQKQPLTTTLAVLGVGIVLGIVLAGGRSSSR